MQDKFEMFDELPVELELETAKNLSNRDLVNLVQTSNYHFSLFKPLVDVRKLLHHVVRGKHDAVQLILIGDISLMVKRGKVTDCSGREFDNISGFEYALWALDKHMWAAMIERIPSNQEGKQVFARLIAQYNKVNTDGVTYRLNGKTITEKHFDFENTLIKELQTQVDSINAPGVKDWDAIAKQWREGIGGAQKRLPMHIVDEYCSGEPFYPVPKFISQPKSSRQFYNWATNKDEDWFSGDSMLGSEFAIYKASSARPSGSRVGLSQPLWLRVIDLDAMKKLCEVRTLDLINLEPYLEEQAGLEYHHQVVQM
ncbi:hypothetical protein Lsan_2497 [Legionella santicrucis]|uniref:SidC homolog n=1 Tax=Legionella santicrucis TaxID=45074 RepID=A0A0W0YLN1_9GAMM|nr:hypothetical protein [Legionella santicrucis]KTD57802.1 hypothetical protein Lsan_2497 [Legionella santicrucis]